VAHAADQLDWPIVQAKQGLIPSLAGAAVVAPPKKAMMYAAKMAPLIQHVATSSRALQRNALP
jgi:hypothetical protein